MLFNEWHRKLLFWTSIVLPWTLHYLSLWILLGASVISSSAWMRCSMCRCKQQGQILILNCSDLQLIDNDGVLRVPYAGSYESHFNFSAISAEFRRSDLRNVTVLTIPKLESLSLGDNKLGEIPPFTFTRLRNLKILSVSNNSLVTIREKSLDGLEKLELLDLSHNKLRFIEPKAFEALSSLKHLFLSQNDIMSILGGVFSLPMLQTLDLSNNNISVLASYSFMNIPNLQNLSLSHNNITIIDKFAFDSLVSLGSLCLSWNNISFFDDSLFSNLNALTELYLDHNKLESLNKNWDLPKTLRRLNLAANFLKSFDEPPSSLANLHELNLEENSLRQLNLKDSTLQNLRILNAAFNNLSTVTMTWKMSFLEEINLSHNQLEGIPSDFIAGRLPALRLLYLDQNPLLSVKFSSDEQSTVSFVNLTQVSLRHLPNLQELGPKDFTALSAPCGLGCGNERCRRRLSLIISHSPRLSSIHPKAFDGVSVCKLDLSYNALTTLDKEVANWRILEEVDLQGNPWDCSCPLQWMLDTLLPHIYQTHPELLYELRCETPAKLRPWRLVHFLNWPGSALCNKMEQLKTRKSSVDQDVSVVTLGSSEAMIIVLGVLAIIFIVLVTVGVIWQRRRTSRRRKYNRRF